MQGIIIWILLIIIFAAVKTIDRAKTSRPKETALSGASLKGTAGSGASLKGAAGSGTSLKGAAGSVRSMRAPEGNCSLASDGAGSSLEEPPAPPAPSSPSSPDALAAHYARWRRAVADTAVLNAPYIDHCK